PGPTAQGQPGRTEYEDAQRHSAAHLQLPERIIADGFARRVFHRTLHGIDQAPISAHRAFELAFPWLAVSFDQVDPDVFPLRQLKDFRDYPGLVGTRRQRGVAHASLAWPAGLADQDFLARTGHGH